MRIVFAAAILGLAACAAPQTARPSLQTDAVAAQQVQLTLFALESRSNDYRRVYSIADRLRSANVDLCPDKRPEIGLMLESLNDYPRDIRQAARDNWGLTEQPSIAWVGEKSPAALAGVRERDVVVSINGETTQSGRRATRDALRLLRRASESGNVALVVRRSGEPLTVALNPTLRCGYGFVMTDDSDLNAFADGQTIVLTRGMMRFVRSDDELALVLAHELAHNSMRHIQAAQQNRLMGALGGAALDVLAAAAGVNTGGTFTDMGGDIGGSMFSQEFESEADYVGMYYMVRAGYSAAGVEDFWRRMAVENPRGVRFGYTHPTYAERFLSLPTVREEIESKVAAGVALTPNMRQ